MSKKKIGVVGLGSIGKKRIRSCLELGFEVHWVYDVDKFALDTVCNDFKVKPLNKSDINWSDVDLVIIATTHNAIKPCALEFLNNGLPVLLEKPCGISIKEIDEIIKVAKSSGIQVFCGYNYRFHPSVQKLKLILDNQNFGKLLKVRARHGHGAREGYEDEWRCQKSLSGGGELVDQGSHLIDLCKFLFGELNYVSSYLSTKVWDSQVEDDCFLHLRCKLDADIFLFASWYEWRNIFSFELFFEAAKFEIQGFNGSYGLETLKCFFQNDRNGPPDIEIFEYPKVDQSWNEELKGVLEMNNTSNANIFDARQTWHIISLAYIDNGY